MTNVGVLSGRVTDAFCQPEFCVMPSEHTQHHLAQITAGVNSLCASVKTRLEKQVWKLYLNGVCEQIPHETCLQYKTPDWLSHRVDYLLSRAL